MQVKRWVLVALLLGSAAVGAVAIIASDVIYHHTSTNAFCTSCHSMAIQADDEYFKRSAHRSNSRGVLASCGDCHIPKTNWFVETYVKATSGARDVYSELTHNFKDPKVWAAQPSCRRKLRPGCAGGTVSPAAAVMMQTRLFRRARMGAPLTQCSSRAVSRASIATPTLCILRRLRPRTSPGPRRVSQ